MKRWLMIAGLLIVALSMAACSGTPAGQGGNVVTTASGLKYQDQVVGTGAEAVPGKTVSVYYTGKLEDGKVFDSNVGKSPLSFTVAAGQMIPGFDQGVQGMKVGGKRTITIPPSLGYGEQGAAGVIPPNATLIFEVELAEVK